MKRLTGISLLCLEFQPILVQYVTLQALTNYLFYFNETLSYRLTLKTETMQ